MSYRSLPPHLHETADAVKKYFRDSQGLVKIKIEEPIDNRAVYTTTLTGSLRDQHLLCVEVTDGGYTNALNSFVLDCMTRGLPVLLYIAIPRGVETQANFTDILKRAQAAGIGIVEIDGREGTVLCRATSLSLCALRRVDVKSFPSKYRQALSDAEGTFRGGNPSKGCAAIYDEIESLSRQLAEKTFKKGYWRAPKKGQKPLKLNFQKGPWQNVLDALHRELDYGQIRKKCANLDRPLIARVMGLTSQRNESSHKPRRRQDLQRRDQRLRTRFENAVDIFHELVSAVKPLRL